jgi:hypothetical protein
VVVLSAAGGLLLGLLGVVLVRAIRIEFKNVKPGSFALFRISY